MKSKSIPNSLPFIRPVNPGDFQLQLSDPNTTTTPIARHTTPCSSARLAANRPTMSQDTSALVPTKQASATVITTAEVAAQKVAHYNDMKKLYECQAVEQALCTQIIKAIDANYLDALRKINTDMGIA